MSKKKLNTTQIANDLKASAFFAQPRVSVSSSEITSPDKYPVASQPSTPPTSHVSLPASKKASTDASVLATQSHSSRETTDTLEVIRKSVKQVGKEVSFIRLTPHEKRQLKDITYTYQSQGIKTSENEISRIGINHLLEDYQAHGNESILARVLAALNA